MASLEQTSSPYLIKIGVLVTMAMTTTVYLILVRWSRVATSEKYITTTTVAVQETMKFILAFVVLVIQSKSFKQAVFTIKTEAIDKPMETLKMSLPSIIYAIQNNMSFIALSNLEVPIQQILYQLKIPVTALCSVFVLKRYLSYQQWMACFMVFVGLALVEYNPESASSGPKDQNLLIGVGAVMVAVFCSALAGVYFEKIIKSSETSIWVRNLQMYLWSSAAAFMAVFMKDFGEIKLKGFFYAYTPIVWFLLCVGSVNGLVVSLVLKYADNIVKGFAAATSIIFSTVASYFLFEYNIGIGFLVGCVIVCSAICLYGIPLPCLSSKFTSVATSKKMSGSGYDNLRSATLNIENDEVNAQ